MSSIKVTDTAYFDNDAEAIKAVTEYLERRRLSRDIENYQIVSVKSIWRQMSLRRKFLWLCWRWLPGLKQYRQLYWRWAIARAEANEAIRILKQNNRCDPDYPTPEASLPLHLIRQPARTYQFEAMIVPRQEVDLPNDIEAQLTQKITPDGMSN